MDRRLRALDAPERSSPRRQQSRLHRARGRRRPRHVAPVPLFLGSVASSQAARGGRWRRAASGTGPASGLEEAQLPTSNYQLPTLMNENRVAGSVTANTVAALKQYGQTVWLDYIR